MFIEFLVSSKRLGNKELVCGKSMCHPSDPEGVREYRATLCDRPDTIVTANNSQDLTAQVLLLKPSWGERRHISSGVSHTCVSGAVSGVHRGFVIVSQSCCSQLMCIDTTTLGF